LSLYVWVQAPIMDACVKAIVAKFFATCKRACLSSYSDRTCRFWFFKMTLLSERRKQGERERFSLLMKGRTDLVFPQRRKNSG
jgi:hypothetical protein